ncbi:MAG: sodium:solute symporter family protein [Myxococcales bacterium]|nr:sodium:solute symporter family protein [Myxococcales bacterium]USN51322.1 MAG: sodium:solute symporter family protein [Myxococcales bacterium]
MSTMFDSGFVFGFLIFVLVVGFLKSRKIRNMREYSIAERKYSLPIMVATVTATTIGGGSSIGMVASIFSFGIVFILISFGNPLNSFLVSQFFVNRINEISDCISVGDIMHKFYGRHARIIAGICGTLYCAAAVGGQVSAIGFIINYFLHIPFALGVAIGCGILIVYSSFGGVKAVTATDVIQFAVLIIAVPMICNVGLHLMGGYSELFERVPSRVLTLPHTAGEIINYFFIFLGFCVPFLDPPTTQRLLMAKDREQIQNTLRWSALIQVCFFIVIGIIALIAVANNADYDPNMAFTHLVSTILPVGLKGIAIAGLLSVVMSTADSYLNAAGIAFVHDVIGPLRQGKISDKGELKLAKWATFMIGSLATVIALSFSSIMSIILFSLNFWGPIIVVPLYAGLLGVKVNKGSFLGGVVGGILAFCIWHFLVEPRLNIGSLIPSMIGNFIGFCFIHFLQKYKSTRLEIA